MNKELRYRRRSSHRPRGDGEQSLRLGPCVVDAPRMSSTRIRGAWHRLSLAAHQVGDGLGSRILLPTRRRRALSLASAVSVLFGVGSLLTLQFTRTENPPLVRPVEKPPIPVHMRAIESRPVQAPAIEAAVKPQVQVAQASPPAPPKLDPKPQPTPKRTRHRKPRADSGLSKVKAPTTEVQPDVETADTFAGVDFSDVIVGTTTQQLDGGHGEGTGTGVASGSSVKSDSASNSKKPARTKASKARPPQLLGSVHWDCPWPLQASSLSLRQQAIIVELDVDRRGRPQQLSVLNDPGYGFGPAALACVRGRRFSPALDDLGRVSGPTKIRVRISFSR